MEELSVVTLSRRKESNIHQSSDLSPLRPNGDEEVTPESYPMAVILRLRVLQIVCGISALVMGSVAFIEERRESNLGLGIPAGGATVLAAAASIHVRGRGTWAGPLAILWVAACCCHLALFVQSVRTLLQPQLVYQSLSELSDEEEAIGASPRDLTVLAAVQMALTAATLACAAAIARLQWRSGGARPA